MSGWVVGYKGVGGGGGVLEGMLLGEIDCVC